MDATTYTIEIDTLELTRDRTKPHVIGWASVTIEPIGIKVGNIKVLKDERGKVSLRMPGVPRNGGWPSSVTLPPELQNRVRGAIVHELYEANVLPRPTPPTDAEPAPSPVVAIVPRAEDGDIPLPASILRVA